MAETSKIAWTDATFNPWRGCTKVSAGCTHCYAETMSHRNPGVLGVWGPGGTRVVAAESYWRQPLKWDREAGAAGERRRVFCASLGDVFEDWRGAVANAAGRSLVRGDFQECLTQSAHAEPYGLDDVRFHLFALIRRTPHLDWLLLTKRPQNVRRMTAEYLGAWGIESLPNVWLGVSVEDQAAADERIPVLLSIPARVRFLSVEPMLSEVDLSGWMACYRDSDRRWQFDTDNQFFHFPAIDWVICGGESGPHARPFDLAWARSLRDQCKAAGVAFFVKQDSGPKSGARGRLEDDLWSSKQFPEVTPCPST